MKFAHDLLINDDDIVSEKLRSVRIQRRGRRIVSVVVSSARKIASTVDAVIAWSYVRFIEFTRLSNEYYLTEYHWNIYTITMQEIQEEIKCNVRSFKISKFWKGKNLYIHVAFIPISFLYLQKMIFIYRNIVV